MSKCVSAILLCTILLSGCTATKGNRELPDNNAAGSDEMKLSPCACQEIDYQGATFQWQS